MALDITMLNVGLDDGMGVNLSTGLGRNSGRNLSGNTCMGMMSVLNFFF